MFDSSSNDAFLLDRGYRIFALMICTVGRGDAYLHSFRSDRRSGPWSLRHYSLHISNVLFSDLLETVLMLGMLIFR